MTLRQLEYLIAVAQAGSFVGAAQVLQVSQPTLSQQIRALESEVGGLLLERTSRQVRLTPAGRALIGEAQNAVASAQRALHAARRAVHAEPEVLTLATVRSLAVAVLPATITRWHQSHPAVSIRIHELANRRQVASALFKGAADLGIGPLPEGWRGVHDELGWEQLVLILPANDPLAHGRDAVPIEALSGREWVMYDERHGLGDQVLAACRAAGFEPQSAVRTTQVEAAARLAAAGIGPALVPIMNVPADLVHQVRGIKPPIAWRVWAFATGSEFSGAAMEFVAVLAEGTWQREPFTELNYPRPLDSPTTIAATDPSAHSLS